MTGRAHVRRGGAAGEARRARGGGRPAVRLSVRAHAHRGRSARGLPRREGEDGPARRASPAGSSRWRRRARRCSRTSTTRAAGFSSTSDRTSWATRCGRRRAARPRRPHRRDGHAVPHADRRGDGARADVDAARQVAAAAAAGQEAGRTEKARSPTADSPIPSQRYRQRYADLAVHPEVRARLPAPRPR